MYCIKYTIFHWEVQRLSELDFILKAIEHMTADGTSFKESENGKGLWHMNLYRALYRNILIGAVCSGAFMEPMFSAIENDHSFAKSPRERSSDSQQDMLDYL